MTGVPPPDLSRYLGGDDLARELLHCGRSRGWTPRVPPSAWVAEDGWSGARVCTIVVAHDDGRLDQVVLKYSPRLTAEPAAYEAALRTCPPTFAPHLVPAAMPAHLPARGGVLTFQRVADEEVRGCVPLAGLPLADRLSACRLIAERVLRDWNPPERAPLVTMTLSTYLSREIGVEMSARGALEEWAGTAGLLPADVPWLTLPGADTVHPNPLALARAGSPASTVPVAVLLGRGHRDLHTLNVLIPRTGAGRLLPNDFLLIDLVDYSDRTPLARDVIFLLLSALAPALRDLPASRGGALARLLSGTATPADRARGDPVLDAVGAVLDTALAAAHLPGHGWRGEWRAQLRLSTLALAVYLTTFGDLGARARWWCYRLAARIGRDALELGGVPVPARGHRVTANPFHGAASPSRPPPAFVDAPALHIEVRRLVARAWAALPGAEPDAAALLREAGEAVRRVGADGGAALACEVQRELLADAGRILGEEDPVVLSIMHDLADWLRRAGSAVAAAAMYRRVASLRERVLGADHPSTLHSWRCSRAFGLGE